MERLVAMSQAPSNSPLPVGSYKVDEDLVPRTIRESLLAVDKAREQAPLSIGQRTHNTHTTNVTNKTLKTKPSGLLRRNQNTPLPAPQAKRNDISDKVEAFGKMSNFHMNHPGYGHSRNSSSGQNSFNGLPAGRVNHGYGSSMNSGQIEYGGYSGSYGHTPSSRGSFSQPPGTNYNPYNGLLSGADTSLYQVSLR